MSNTSVDSADSAGIYRRLLGYVNPYRGQLALAIFAMIIYAGSSTAFAALMKPMLDGSFVERDMQSITIVPILIVVIFVFRGLAGFFSTYLMAKIGWSIVKQIRLELFDKYLDTPTATFDHSSAGDMISRVTFNVRNMSVVATDCLTILVRDSLSIIGLLCLMLYHSWKLSLGFLLLGPLVTMIVIFVSGRFRKLNFGIQDSMGKVASVIEEAVEGQRLVKVFGGREYERQHFEAANEINRSLNVKETFTRAASAPIIQFLVAIALAIIVFLASSGRYVGEISVGVFMSFITAMMMLFAPIKQLTLVNAKIQAGVAAGQSVFEVLDSDSERDTGTIKLDSRQIEVAFESVDFSYSNGKSVISNLNFTVAAGETIALVGGSGSGKSTIANLIPRLYDVTDGRIAINSTDIRDYTLASLREHISYVGQEVTLFNDTVLANIAYGQMQGAEVSSIKEACRAAHAHEFIEKLSDGYQTVVGENGVMLSGGQRQRIAIARAILKDAPLLVLDEATSALDTESERKVQQGLAELMQNRSTIVIAHRLSTIENADRIIVMDAGNIVEIGSHDELLNSNGYYAYLQGRLEDNAGHNPV